MWNLISYNEFSEELNKADSRDEEKLDYFRDLCEGRTYDYITDSTSESLSEDERDYVETQSDLDVYIMIVEDHIKTILGEAKDKIPFEEIKKYMNQQEIQEYERATKILEESTVLNKI